MSASTVVGRELELERIGAAVEGAFEGRGALLMFAGEAGIGKTSLAEAFAATAVAAGAQVAWGRCWEAGGAPPYWPWSQVFRSLQLADPFATEQGAEAGKEARFRLFDRAEEALRGRAQERPVALVLDDLHASDVPSLLLLHLLARNLRGARLAIVATWRAAEARLAGEPGELLAKLAREGELHLLERLSPEQIARWIRDALPEASDETICRVQASSEGNPLFVRELLRVGGAPRGGRVPETLRALLDEHIGRVSTTARELLSVAAVLGREWSDQLAVALSGFDVDDAARAFDEARDAGLIVDLGGGRHAFSHMLLRERLHDAPSPSRRAAIHAVAGQRLAAGDPIASAHHFFEAGDPRAATVALDAGRKALSQLAFEDAAALAERALAIAGRETSLGVELLLLRAQALVHLGNPLGRGLAVEAGALAERLGEPRLLAEAALVHGSETMIGANDPNLIDLLERARAGLGDSDGSLLCRVLARHSAAIAPPKDHEAMVRAPRMAREAIEMARRLGDRDALLQALRHAVGSIGCGRRRTPVVDELVQLADELGRPLVLLESLGLHAMMLRERGHLSAMTETRDRWSVLLAEHPRPQYAWRLPLHLAWHAVLDGDSDLAARKAEEGWQIAETSGNMPGRIAWAMHRLMVWLLSGEPMPAKELERAVEAMARMAGPNFGRALLHGALLHDDREARLLGADVRLPLAHADSFENLRLAAVAEVAVQLRDEALARSVADGLAAHCHETPVFWGPHGVAMFGPLAFLAARVMSFLGRASEAVPLFDEALALAERMKAPALAARIARERDALGARSPARRPSVGVGPRPFAMQRDGDVWRIDCGSATPITLKDAKGFAYLDELTRHPGRELHVTQLAGIDELSGDAGPVLDPKAKAAYQERLEALRDRLEEARANSNFAVAERAEAEIDALVDELARAVGLGGRDRKLGSPVERARINVQRRLKDAIRRIGEHDPEVSAWLAATVKTGTFCIFRPV